MTVCVRARVSSFCRCHPHQAHHVSGGVGGCCCGTLFPGHFFFCSSVDAADGQTTLRRCSLYRTTILLPPYNHNLPPSKISESSPPPCVRAFRRDCMRLYVCIYSIRLTLTGCSKLACTKFSLFLARVREPWGPLASLGSRFREGVWTDFLLFSSSLVAAGHTLFRAHKRHTHTQAGGRKYPEKET